MKEASGPSPRPDRTLKRFGVRLMALLAARLELLLVEVQEERDQVVRLVVFILVAFASFAMAFAALNVAVVVYFWAGHPVIVLLGLAGFYGVIGLFALRRLSTVTEKWESFPETLKEIKKDRQWMEKSL